MSETKFKPVMGLWDATMIVAGSMIGSGIFIVSADIVRNVGSAGWLIAVWAITGFMTITAAVSYGELSGMYPKAGGQYVYLKEAYNSLMAFLYGWSFFAVIQTATIAAVGVAFSRFTAYLIPAVGENVILLKPFGLTISAAQVLAIAMIALLTYTNTRGIQGGKIIQNTFTAAKLIALFGLIILGFLLVKESFWTQNWQTGFNSMQDLGAGGGGKVPTGWMEIGGMALLGAIAASMTGSIFSSDAWNNVTFIAGEIKNPKRNIGLSLFLGTFMVTMLYITANLMYLHVLPLDGIAYPQADRLAISAANEIFGASGTLVIAVLIMVSTFGCNNGLILAGARVYYTMAKDGLFFKKAGELNKNSVPQWALWAQALVASLLCLSGEYGNLLDMVSFVVVIFYALTIIGIFILRKKQPNAERPYKAFGYPVLPAIYVIMAFTFCTMLIIYKPQFTWPGLIITLAGIPIYFWVMRNKKDPATS
ncbi:MAG TPA: amino acid permease [Cyclobacteriaceae bacterium]|nr:amino acid permease [Cyclobacteriaceae bacterium]HMV10418.1 amino acid permease [Cyclobacteriaceae bacterium]HMV90428.1 amino acid permease [Cyclobacteriaceae bacterium]HMX01341.1 amino acid permease [Cyclobacteriaceae bacterium]HMX50388.1 amino acid permease [Cyclobacteriaceae bacterium]